MRNLLFLLAATSALASCGVVRNTADFVGLGQGPNNGRVEIEGTRYKARISADRDDRRAFSVTVRPVAPNPDAAKEAGRYEATRHCLTTYGGSDTDWILGPDTPIEQLTSDGESLTMRGRCTQK